MNRSAPIGVFDSGIGGLSVWNELIRELPDESFIYVADSANAPYGNKTKQFITDRSRAISAFLSDSGCKLIVVACNTATGAAISTLRKEFAVPFIGVEPAIKPAALESKSGHIGVLATAQTFKGEHFKRSIEQFGRFVEVHERAGTGLVELIENGKTDSPETRKLLKSYLYPMVEQGIDQLVLGCTHYPFLIPVIREMVPEGIHIIDPAPAVARQTHKVLEDHAGRNTGNISSFYSFYTTGDAGKFNEVLAELIGCSYLADHLSV